MHTPVRPRILVVEDEIFIALDIAETLEELGFEVIGPVSTPAAALGLSERSRPDAALLDVNLGGGLTTEPIAARLRDLGIPFAFLTAYQRDTVAFIRPEDPIISKPVSPQVMAQAIAAVGITAQRV